MNRLVQWTEGAEKGHIREEHLQQQYGIMGKELVQQQYGAMGEEFVQQEQQHGAMEEKNLEQQQLGAMEEEKNLEQQHLGAMEEEKNVEQQQLGAMEEEKNVEQQQLAAMKEEKNVEQQRQQHGAMGEKVYSMDNKVLELPYVPIHELDVAFSVEVVPDDVPLVNPDAETQDTRELLLSGIWKKKVGTMNVGVQVGGDDVNVTKQEVARGNNVVDAVKKSKWDDIDDPKKNPIVGEMLHLHSPEYFNVDGSIKPPKNDIVGKED